MVICFTHSFPNKVSNKGDFWVEHLTWKTGIFCVAGQQHVTERNNKDLSILHSWTLPKMLSAFSLLFSVCFWITHHLYSCDFHLHLYSCWQLILKACTENEFKEKQEIIWHVMDLGLVMSIKCFWDLCACCVLGTIDWLGGQTSSSVAHMAKLEEGNTSSNCSFLECKHLTCNWDRVGNYSSQIHQLSCTGKPGKIMYCDQLMVIDGFCERFVTLTLICWWLFHVQIWETFTDQTFCLQQGRKFGL
jgi:hypothetical protein